METNVIPRINGWLCDTCAKHTFCVDIDDGVTPMFLACRAEGVDPAEARCKGQAKSLMYPAAPPPPHVVDAVKWEWYRPGPVEMATMNEALRDHVERGGLNLRQLTDSGRRALAGVTGGQVPPRPRPAPPVRRPSAPDPEAERRARRKAQRKARRGNR